MRTLQKTLFIIALIALLTQTVRHVYARWFEHTGSRLDKYEQPVKGEIEKARSLDELVKRYEEARKKEEEARKKEEEARKKMPHAENSSVRSIIYSDPDSELLKRDSSLNDLTP